MNTKSILIWAIILFVIDQIIKVVVNQFFLEVKFAIITQLFYFQPTFNHHYSWINSLFKLGRGFWEHIIIFSFDTLLIVSFLDLMRAKCGKNKLLSIAFVFCFAGLISSFIGTIIWNGCLYYIYLKPLFVFDLKDLYLNAFAVLLLVYFLKNRKLLSTITTKDVIYHFKNRFKSHTQIEE